MTNTELLKKKIKDSGLKLKFICDKLDIGYNSLQKKVDGDVEFVASEVNTICEVLQITDAEEMKAIFFASDVEESSTMGE